MTEDTTKTGTATPETVGEAAKNLASIYLFPDPKATVNSGCKLFLKATTPVVVPGADNYAWTLLLPDGSRVTKNEKGPSVTFEIIEKGFGTGMGGGSGSCRVFCQVRLWDSAGHPRPGYVTWDLSSDPIPLEFAGKPANLHHVTLTPGRTKGGDAEQDKKVTMEVVLDGPVLPCPGAAEDGARVDLKSDNPAIARIVGPGYFMIPPGKDRGSISWFIGTKKIWIGSSKTCHIIATVKKDNGFATLIVSRK